MAENIRLPIKVVLPDPDDIRAREGTSSKRKIFDDEETLDTSRSRLSREVRYLGDYFRGSFAQNPTVPAVGLVSLKKDALAKTHRPARILRKSNCPIIGVAQLGDLLRSYLINQREV